MGFFKKAFKPIRKVAKKFIPKEVRPFLPYIAAGFGPVGAGTFASGIKAASIRGLIAGATSAATDEKGNPLRAGILAAAPGLIADTSQLGAVNAELAGMGKTANFLDRTSDFVKANKGLKTIGAQTTIDQSAKFAEIRQDEIDQYNKNLLEQGVASKVDRRKAIFGIYKNAGYDDDYVNTMLDTYGYASGGRVGFAGGGNYESYKDYLEQLPNNEVLFDLYLAGDMAGLMRELKRRGYDTSDDYASGGRIGYANGGGKIMTMEELLEKTGPIVEKIESIEDEDEDEAPRRRREPDMAGGLAAAMNAVQTAYGRSFGEMEPVPMMRFARGGEVEIEEQTDDLGIMDLMRDQGVEYGEQVSNAQNDELLEKLFEEFIDLGFSPEDAAKKAREAFDDMSQGQGIKGTQVASGYKNDIEELYEQYVFEMEEQGLQPMDFAAFLRQAKAGMASGGIMNRNLLNTGVDKDMRGGGFIPEGTKEKADDVPARLSKNEFVMTADAVRAAGGGSVNEGAKRMYDAMHKLEAKV